MEHVLRRVFLDPTLPELTRDERLAVYGSMNESLARLHDVNYRTRGLEGYGREDSYCVRQVKRWTQQYRAKPMSWRRWID